MSLLQRLCFVLLVTLIALPGSVAAQVLPSSGLQPRQQDGTVTYDVPVEGTITAEAPAQPWTLVTEGADRIQVRVERLSGNLIPDVRIQNADGQDLAASWGADQTRALALIADYTLPAAGSYTVLVSRDGGPDGLSTGTYRLTVIPRGVSVDHPANAAIAGALTFDTPVSGTISALHWHHRFTLEGTQGDVIRITARRVDGTLYPLLRLLDSNGAELRTGWPNDTQEVAQIDSVELPYSGTYVVAVERDRGISGDTVGTFSLSLALLGSGINAPHLANAEPGIIEAYDTPFRGTLTHDAWYQDWVFRTEATDLIPVVVQRDPPYTAETPNTLIPMVYLLDANGIEKYRAYASPDGTTATISRYQVPAAGLYTVRVTRDREKTGATTGSYRLTIVLDGAGENSPFLQGTPGTVSAGAPVQGTLSHARWRESWTFSGDQGQQFNFIVTRKDGTLVPMLEVRDSNGITLRTAWPIQTGDIAALDSFTLPYTGSYQIVVQRDGRQDGYTIGDYELLIQPAP